MPSAISSPATAVIGTLLHADAWDALSPEEVARRSLVSIEQAQVILDRYVGQKTILQLHSPGDDEAPPGPRYRLSTAGVTYARELTGETPRAWR